jgi:hypothetical protein
MSKKESWWKKLVPKCGGGKTSTASPPNNLSTQLQTAEGGVFKIACANCGEVQPIIENLSAFVCCKCHKVNRIMVESNRRTGTISSDDSAEPVMLVRTSSSTFLPAEFVEDIQKQRKEMEPIIPHCSVCMDAPGDVVLLPCSHSAICEECAKHIAKNKSVGGSHCPRCREDIKSLLRLSELYPEGDAKGVPIVIPKEDMRSGPPRVPPPPGLNKAKNNNS